MSYDLEGCFGASVIRRAMAALHSTVHVHINTMPDICTLTYTFAWL